MIKLAGLLNLNIRETNNLLASAGFAPSSIALKPDSAEHRWLQRSLIYTLRGLDPFPSMIIDQNGNARMINRAWLELVCQYAPATAETDSFNLIDFIFAEQGFRPYLQDWEDTICALIMTLQQDVLMYQDPAAVSLLQRILAEPEVPDDWRQRGANQMNITGFMTRTHLPGQKPERQMHVVHTVGATSFVSEPKLMIYTIYPTNPDRASVWESQIAASQKNASAAILLSFKGEFIDKTMLVTGLSEASDINYNLLV